MIIYFILKIKHDILHNNKKLNIKRLHHFCWFGVKLIIVHENVQVYKLQIQNLVDLLDDELMHIFFLFPMNFPFCIEMMVLLILQTGCWLS